MMNDLINRQSVLDIVDDLRDRMTVEGYWSVIERVKALPSATCCNLEKPERPQHSEGEAADCNLDCISRQAAIDALNKLKIYRPLDSDRYVISDCLNKIVNLPSAQPERTCVNCGRTANNGGWYADGRTRCPIEEHYALPKDGYCHLWEKRNVTDDDYPERREE